MRKGQPNPSRASELHEKIFGTAIRPGEGGDTIHAVQQLVYLEESCEDILAAIKGMETDGQKRDDYIEELRGSLAFVARLVDDRKLLQTLRYQQRRA